MNGVILRARERYWLILWTLLSLGIVGYMTWSSSMKPESWLDPLFILNILVLAVLYGFHLRADRWMLTFGTVLTFNLYIQDGIVSEWVAHFSALLLVILFQRRWSLKLIVRWFNGSIFCSSGAALAYSAVDFLDPKAIDQILPGVFVYLDDIAYILAYIVLLYGMRSIDVALQEDWNEQMFFPNWKWETFTLFLLPPFSMLMQTFAQDGDQLAIVYLMVPLLALSYIFYLYAKMEDMHLQLVTIHELSHAFSAELKMDKALAAFYEGLRRIVPFQAVYLFELGEDRQTLIPTNIERTDYIEAGNMQEFKMAHPLVYPFTRKTMSNWKEAFEKQIPAHEHISVFPMAWNRVIRGFAVIAHAKAFDLRGRKRVLAEILIRQLTVALHNSRRYEVTKQRSREDELTGLINQRHFESRLFQELTLAQQQERSFAVMLMDIDFFKKVNDSYGHLAGNQVLKQVAAILRDSIGPEDVVARYGGEEFALIIRYADQRRAQFLAEQIRIRIEEHPFEIQSDLDEQVEPVRKIFDQEKVVDEVDSEFADAKPLTIRVTVSIGVSVFPDHAEDAHGLIRLADRAMYVGAKQAGRNRVALYRK